MYISEANHEDPKDCESRYGKIISTKFVSYWKYEFEIDITTDRGRTYRIRTGGDTSWIAAYDPLSTDWAEHVAAEILYVEPSYTYLDLPDDVDDDDDDDDDDDIYPSDAEIEQAIKNIQNVKKFEPQTDAQQKAYDAHVQENMNSGMSRELAERQTDWLIDFKLRLFGSA
jgi:hypothetical protein